jgi:glucose dehydrogenase
MNRILLLLITAGLTFAQDWQSYGGDPGGTRYSPLKEINRSNVAKLKTAWTYHTGDVSDGTEYPVRSAFEATPLMIDGVLYVVTVFGRLIALEPETGKQLWAFDPKLDKTRAQMLFSSRGARRQRKTYSTARSMDNFGPSTQAPESRSTASAPAASWICARA